MSSLSKFWRIPALFVMFALPLAVACADDEGALPPEQPTQPTTGTISGTVTAAADGSPIVGALVGTSPATTTALTDAQGNYSITNVPIPSSGSASFAVTASKEGFNSASQSVTLSAQSPTATANLQLARPAPDEPTPGRLNVLVTNRDGEAQADADVTVLDAGGNEVASDETDANGFAMFNDLDAGSYTVTATKSISTFNFKASAGVNVNAGETAFVQLTLRRDHGQSTIPNIDGDPVTLGEGSDIRLVRVPGGDSTPEVDCNIIRTQHMFIAEVVNEDGKRVSGVKVEWDLNISENGTVSTTCPELSNFIDPGDEAGCTIPTVPGNTGSIVDTDDPDLDPATARSGMNPAFKVDSRNAVTFTNDGTDKISFGGSNNVDVGPGQTWIIITSPVEGLTDVIVSTPDIPNTNPDCAIDDPTACDKEFAIKRWVNWDISVFELDIHENEPNAFPGERPVFWPDPGELEASEETEIRNGALIFNVLDRDELTETRGSEDPGCLALAPAGSGVSDEEYCELTDNQANFQVRIERLRGDSPFNMSRGFVRMTVTDDTPDVDFWGEGSTNGAPPTTIAEMASSSGCVESSDNPRAGSPTVDICNVEANGPTDDQFAVNLVTRNTAVGEFDANNNVFDGGTFGYLFEDEDDFIGWVNFQVRLNPATYFCIDDGDGDCEPNENPDDEYSEAYQRLLAATVDNTNTFAIQIFDEFGEVCGTFTFRKRWVTSRLTIIKTTPGAVRVAVPESRGGPAIAGSPGNARPVKTHTVQVGQPFSYTVTVINDGEVESKNVRITDTLPRFSHQFCDPAEPGEPGCGLMRGGHQAFVFQRDRPAFDPVAVVYAIDNDNDEGGNEIDRCIVGRDGSAKGAAYTVPAPCDGIVDFAASGSISQARANAVAASTAGPAPRDQVVWIQWFDDEVLARTDLGGGIQSEDSVEVFLIADASLYGSASAGPDDRFPSHNDIPGTWCNIATVTDGPDNGGTSPLTGPGTSDPDDLRIQSFDADTLCHEVREALLDVRKTADDAVITAGEKASWLVEISNNGSAALTGVAIHDTLDAAFEPSDDVCDDVTVLISGGTCTDTGDVGGKRTFTIDIGVLNPTSGFVDAYRVSVTSPRVAGTFCNRVTAVGSTPGGPLKESDISCITTTVAIEMDIVNEDGFIDDDGAFQSDKEIFTVGESGEDFAFRVIITNQSAFTATGVRVTDVLAPNTGIFTFDGIRSGFPVKSMGGSPGGVTVTGDSFVWSIGTLLPGQIAEIQFFAEAERAGDDVNRVTLTADQLTSTIVNEETTSITGD